jgi:hypothetical protein
MPEPNEEVVVRVESDTPLFCMEAAVYVIGDANILDAMDSNEAPNYGWDPGWNCGPFIDDANGWVDFGGVRWVADANGTVGYLKFRYNSGQIGVYFDQQFSMAYAWDSNSNTGPAVPFSTNVLLFGEFDPNQMMQGWPGMGEEEEEEEEEEEQQQETSVEQTDANQALSENGDSYRF